MHRLNAYVGVAAMVAALAVGSRSAEAARPDATLASLTVRTEPPGVAIKVDGKLQRDAGGDPGGGHRSGWRCRSRWRLDRRQEGG